MSSGHHQCILKHTSGQYTAYENGCKLASKQLNL